MCAAVAGTHTLKALAKQQLKLQRKKVRSGVKNTALRKAEVDAAKNCEWYRVHMFLLETGFVKVRSRTYANMSTFAICDTGRTFTVRSECT